MMSSLQQQPRKQKRCPPAPAPTPESVKSGDDDKTIKLFRQGKAGCDVYSEKKINIRLREWAAERTLELDTDFFTAEDDETGSNEGGQDGEDNNEEEKAKDKWSISQSGSELSPMEEFELGDVQPTTADAQQAASPQPRTTMPRVPSLEASLRRLNEVGGIEYRLGKQGNKHQIRSSSERGRGNEKQNDDDDACEKDKKKKNVMKREGENGQQCVSFSRSKTDNNVLRRSDTPPPKKTEIRPFNLGETRKKMIPKPESPAPFRARECPSHIRNHSVGAVGIPTATPKPTTTPKEFNLSQSSFFLPIKEPEYTFRARAAPKYEFTPLVREAREPIVPRAPRLRTSAKCNRTRSESPAARACGEVLFGSPTNGALSRTPPRVVGRLSASAECLFPSSAGIPGESTVENKQRYPKFRARPVPPSVLRRPTLRSSSARPPQKREVTTPVDMVLHSARRAEKHEEFRKSLVHRREENMRLRLLHQSQEKEKLEEDARSLRKQASFFRAIPVPQSTYVRKNMMIPALYPITIPKSPRLSTRVRERGGSIDQESIDK